MEISYCPYRTSISQSKILYTTVSPAITFTGTKKDVELLEKVRKQNAGEEDEPEPRE